MTRALVLALCVAGCADLPAFDQKCGNGVIDEDEDCDSAVGCSQCRATCPSGTDMECMALPGEYHCGADAICHAASGVFVQQGKPSFSFVVGQGAVADLDGDHIGDVVGFSDITIDVRFGDLDAGLTTRATALLPYTNSTIAFRTFDPDHGLTDIIVPTPEGITAYTASNKQLVAYPFAGSPGASGACVTINGTSDPVLTFELDKRRLAFVARNFATGDARLGVLDVVTGECKDVSLCGMTMPPIQDLPQLFYDQYATQTNPLSSVIAVGIPRSFTAEQVCVLRFSGVPGSFSLTSLNQAPTTPFDTAFGSIALARTQVAAACPALFTPRADGIDVYAAAGVAGACTLTTTAAAMPGFGAGTAPAGRIPLVPAIANRAPDALVTINGTGFLTSSDVYSLAGTSTYFMYHSPRPLYPVRAADLDGDGTVEAVATAATGTPTGNPDFDILYRTAPPIDSFVPYRITTQGAPTQFALGDFDGNGLYDIAYTERVGPGERLMLAYSTPDRPLPAVEIASFNQIVAFARIDVPDSIEPSGQVLDDLVVADMPPGAMMPTLTFLHGNPQRSMLAYFDPRGAIGVTESQFVSAVTGNFDNATAATDVMAFELNNTTAAVQMWLATGSVGSERLIGASQPLATNIEGLPCSPTSAAPLCLDGARLLPWPIAGRDVVIAVDAQNRVGRSIVTIDPARAVGGTLTIERPSDPSTKIDPAPFAFAVWGADIDGNGLNNLLVSLGGVRGFGGNKHDVLDCIVDDQGNVTSCRSLTTQIHGLDGWTCQGAEPGTIIAHGRHDPTPTSPAQDVLALCKRYDAMGTVLEGHVFRLHWVGDGYLPEVVVRDAASYEFLSIGDINGDHVDDLAGISFDPTFTPIVDIHVQCEARAATCRSDNFVGGPFP